jgi:hypothetical protein
MSYEGRVQVLCENGHYSELDPYDSSPRSKICEICGATGWSWQNSVDDTNCDSIGYVDIEQHVKHRREVRTEKMADGRWATFTVHAVYEVPGSGWPIGGQEPRPLRWDYVDCVWRDLKTDEVVQRKMVT